MNAISQHQFGNHSVRIVMRNAEPWFVATDICAAMDYKNTSKAITDHLDDDERYNESLERGGTRTLINESGLYALVLRSRKPEARKFAKWVTSEVLPSIRKTGQYSVQPATITPTQQQHLKELVDLIAESGKQTHAETWARLHRKFSVPRYTALPAAQFDAACQYLRSKLDHPSIATLVQKHLPQHVELELTSRRWLLTFTNGHEVLTPLSSHDCILNYADLPKYLAASDNGLAPELLSDIACAAMQQLAKSATSATQRLISLHRATSQPRTQAGA